MDVLQLTEGVLRLKNGCDKCHFKLEQINTFLYHLRRNKKIIHCKNWWPDCTNPVFFI